jgi:hypothetical protein
MDTLLPFEKATVMLSGEKYWTMSLIVLIITSVIVQLSKLKSSHSEIKYMIDNLLASG